MIKRLALLILFLAPVAAGLLYFKNPAEFTRQADLAVQNAPRVWSAVEAYPVPVVLAVGTFLLTVLYHTAKGKSFRESVEVAATRVAVVQVPVAEPPAENPVVTRAKARATRTQLLADQIGLENRQRKLPEEIVKAEKEVCYAEQAVSDAKRALGEKHKAHNKAVAALKALRAQRAEGDAELAAIKVELQKLAQLV
jgi:hypothetical protein